MNIGLVLSGGAAKGAYQIGALRALSQFIPLQEIKYISCSSIGVLNGYAYATGKLEQAEQMWRDVCNNDTRLIVNQILRSSMLQQNIRNLYDSERKLPCVFYCSLLDLPNRNVVYKDLSTVSRKRIPLYLKASVAVPIYNRSVQIGNISYFDGAIGDNIPVYPLMKHNLDYIICIYFDNTCYRFENELFDSKVIKIALPAESVLKEFVVFEHDSIENMIQFGYDKTMYTLKLFFSEGYDNLDYIYRTIEYMNNHSIGNMRITGDVLARNLNKFTQRLTKRKII